MERCGFGIRTFFCHCPVRFDLAQFLQAARGAFLLRNPRCARHLLQFMRYVGTGHWFALMRNKNRAFQNLL